MVSSAAVPPKATRFRAEAVVPPKATQGGAEVYDYLYDQKGYHGETSFSQEGPVVDMVKEFLPAGGPCKLGKWCNASPLTKLIVIGCSHGKGVKALSETGFDASGMDVAHKAVDTALQVRGQTCTEKPCFRQGALGQMLPFESQAFDIGVSSDVLEHIPEAAIPEGVVEISRIVKHFLILRIANFPEYAGLGEKLGMGNLHVTTFPAPWWMKHFAPHGWKLICELPQRPDIWRDPFVFIVLGRTSADISTSAGPCPQLTRWWKSWMNHSW
mmetsp:Transcript_34159/g.88244  ORF Transcript_34159/g.88244 Transcript_34159/m.88244 type:complete len:270 (+) Transcript_34159:45-854(+)